jgi:hypothetical protein
VRHRVLSTLSSMTSSLGALTLTTVVLLVPSSVFAQSRASDETLASALRAARDADLRADWDALLEARARVSDWDGAATAPALVSYHLGYIDWRLSSRDGKKRSRCSNRSKRPAPRVPRQRGATRKRGRGSVERTS